MSKNQIRWRLIAANPVLFITGISFMGLTAYMGCNMAYAVYLIVKELVCPH